MALETRTQADLDNRFDYHAPDEAKKTAHETARMRCKTVACWAAEMLPESRERALAITKLEEAMFWINAAIARGEILDPDSGE